MPCFVATSTANVHVHLATSTAVYLHQTGRHCGLVLRYEARCATVRGAKQNSGVGCAYRHRPHSTACSMTSGVQSRSPSWTTHTHTHTHTHHIHTHTHPHTTYTHTHTTHTHTPHTHTTHTHTHTHTHHIHTHAKLGAFAKSQKASISFVVPARHQRGYRLMSKNPNFVKIRQKSQEHEYLEIYFRGRQSIVINAFSSTERYRAKKTAVGV